ncbi:MAG: CDP-alcohol phosphatidyltransferase family protein [Patescibacteria group bacterium]|nr:CDP-alcohol phosphatidyltransferase family protein [Patescibacteria group bacterium]
MTQKFFDNLLAQSILRLIPRLVLPNHVTMLRFILIPPIAYLLLIDQMLWSFVLFVVAALTDAIDGAMARTRNQITEWGEFFDPLADKFLVGVVVMVLVTKYISVFVAGLIVGIELLLIIVALHLKLTTQKRIKAQAMGKVKMATQVLALILLFVYILSSLPLFLISATWCFYLAIAFAVVSVFIYRSI